MSFDPTLPRQLGSLPPRIDFRDVDILESLALAHQELGELKGLTVATPNPLLLISPAILRESVASSEIENIHTTVAEVLQGQLFPEAERTEPDKEVLRYKEAVLWGSKNLEKLAVSTRLICGIHKQLLPEARGEFRRIQNKIENSRTKETIYTPPIAADIPRMLGNWERFVNDKDDRINPLIKCAIAHYQFEAIHPFEDGNGRTGRILMVLSLMDHGILTFPFLYVSGYLNENRAEYYKRLLAVTREGDWKGFILFILTALQVQARQTKETLSAVLRYYDEFKKRLRQEHKGIYSADLVDHLFEHPITMPARLAEALDIHHVTASKYLMELVGSGILKDQWHGKYHLFVNERLIRLMRT